MTTTKTHSKSSVLMFAGIDVGATELLLVIHKNGVAMKVQKFANTPVERLRLLKRLARFPGITVGLEAIDVFHRSGVDAV